MPQTYALGFNDAGRFTMFPGVSSHINAEALDAVEQGPTGIVAILGIGAGFLEPKKVTSLPLALGSPARMIAPSDLLEAAKFAVRPFQDLDRAVAQVLVVPVTPATHSQLELMAGASVTLTLISAGWGLKMNELVASVVGTRLTIKFATANIVEVYDQTGTVEELAAAIKARSAIVQATFGTEGAIDPLPETAFTGGTEPAATPTDWEDALNALSGIRVNCITVVSPSAVIHSMLAAYCVLKRARGFIGSDFHNWNGVANRQTSLAELAAEAAALNERRLMHIGLGAEGKAPYIAAARYAALAGALEPSVPMTRKLLGFASLEAILDVDTEIGGVDGALINGIAMPAQDPAALGTFMVSRGLSTMVSSANLYDREHSILAAVDAIQFECELQLRTLLGGEGTANAVRRGVEKVDTVLSRATRPTSAIRIVSYKRESIVGHLDGTVLHIAATFTPIEPINWIRLGMNLERTDITINLERDLAAAA